MDLGLFLSSEEHPASDLIQAALVAETSGIDRVLVSDHFHPWLDAQGGLLAVCTILAMPPA
jgi:alkanesulfonate monooxygenase SsuD/methylene tetrahydromethanopterin reductase-like flavin-dependent oxidoreductase (luciferase family)